MDYVKFPKYYNNKTSPINKMPFLTESQIVLPRMNPEGHPTDDNIYHSLPSICGSRTVQGFMGDDWMKSFFYALGYFTRGTAVELGSFNGLSSVLFGMGMRDSPWQAGHLLCIDWFKDGFSPDHDGDILEKFNANVQAFGVQHHVTPIQGSCEDPNLVKNTELEWVYFDASHFAKELRVNIDLYYPMVKPGGLLLFHDTHMPEVVQCIEECQKDRGIVPVITDRPDFQCWMKSQRRWND